MTTSAGPNTPAPDLLVLLHERADAMPPVRLTLADRVRVEFAGSRGGEGPVTISQGTTLSWVTNPAFPTRMVEWSLSLPEGTTLADISAALRILMARHEALRTCYPSAPGEPVQRVIRSGDLIIDVYAAADEPADDAVLVIGLTGLLRAREFDLAAELPLRVAVAVWQDTPRAAVILFSHMAADMAAMVQLGREFTALITDPSSREVGPPGFQPLDLAEEEHSARGRRRHEAAVRGWETVFRTMPQCLYAVPSADPGRDGGVVSGWFWSRAGALALAPVVARTSASRQSVVFAALCVMMGWRTGHDTCVLPVIASNRYQRNLRDYIGTLVQDGITSLDVRARTFDEVVRRAVTAVLRANRSSLIKVEVLERATEEAEHQRGIIRERYCTFNDISVYLPVDDSVIADSSKPRTMAEIRQALDQSRFAQLPAPGAEETLLKLIVQQVDGELVLNATARDANRVPLAELEMLLRGTESLLIAAASGDIALSRLGEVTGVQPIARGPGWVRIGPSWIDLAEVQRLVEDALPAAAAAFAIVGPAAAEPELIAYLAAGGGIDTPEQAHAACMATLAGTRGVTPPDGIRYTAMAPGRYIICARAPGDVHDLAGWQRQAVVAEGDGRRRLPRIHAFPIGLLGALGWPR
jgi:Condensation domain